MNHSTGSRLLYATVRHGHPDFVDLPWGTDFADWPTTTRRHESVPQGVSRHPVTFVNYDDRVYALKELPPGVAETEFRLLREMETMRLPVVEAVGYARVDRGGRQVSVLLTRYLENSLPYESLFQRSSLERYRVYLLDALACLLVQLHLKGVFWGDCSLSNTLYRRDAGRLTAYLVDAETSEVHAQMPDELRRADLAIMHENVCGGLLDLQALGVLPAHFAEEDIGGQIRTQYESLWNEITCEEVIAVDERYRIDQRVRALNQLGFAVEQIELHATDNGNQLRLRAQVTDRNFHRDLLHTLTGLDPEEMQARQMLNEIHEYKAVLAARENRSISLSGAAYQWVNEVFKPTIARLAGARREGATPAETYCQLLEHKWYLSERERRDVGRDAAIDDFLTRFGS